MGTNRDACSAALNPAGTTHALDRLMTPGGIERPFPGGDNEHLVAVETPPHVVLIVIATNQHRLSSNHRNISLTDMRAGPSPTGMKSMRIPYGEAPVGVEATAHGPG